MTSSNGGRKRPWNMYMQVIGMHTDWCVRPWDDDLKVHPALAGAFVVLLLFLVSRACIRGLGLQMMLLSQSCDVTQPASYGGC
jgi:hypothetical protein